MRGVFLDSNNFSIGIHFFKVLVQIHYSRSPAPCICLLASKNEAWRASLAWKEQGLPLAFASQITKNHENKILKMKQKRHKNGQNG